MSWPYYVCPRLSRVSIESTDTLSKGVSISWPYYVCPRLSRVSMESTDTLSKGYPCLGHTMYVQGWAEYPWNPRILYQGGIHVLAILCMSKVEQSIHGIHGYFVKGVSVSWPYYVCPRLGRVFMKSTDTLSKGVSMSWPYYVCPRLSRVSMESMDTLSKGYPCLGHTMYVQGWAEYPWNPRILYQRGYPCLGHTMYVQG